MAAIQEEHRYSSNVALALEVGNDVLSVAQVGPNWLILASCERAPLVHQEATIIISVEGKRHIYPVVICDVDELSRTIEFE